MHRRGILAIVLIAAYSSAFARAQSDTWPQWRGPTRDGQFTGPRWPNSLDEKHLRQLWRIELGPSYSGPIVSQDMVFTTETKDAKYEIVHARDRRRGKQIWTAKWEGAMTVPFFAWANGSWIRATPAYDGESLYVAGMRDVLVCLDARTGAERWRVDFVKQFNAPLPSFGFVCSPFVDETAVYVQAGASFVKLDKYSGKIVWRTLEDKGGMNGSAFSSPAFATVGGVPQLVVQTRQQLAGVDPKDGQVLWSENVPAMRGMNILTPVFTSDRRIFTSAYGGKSFLYQVGKTEDKWTVSHAWSTAAQAYMSTPVVIDDHAYLLLRNQKFTCVDLKTGKQTWTTSEAFGRYWSLVAQNDRLLGLDENGTLYLLKANPKAFEVIDKRKISERETWAHLAVAGRQIFIREQNALTSFEFP